jgi:hypothetical protein
MFCNEYIPSLSVDAPAFKSGIYTLTLGMGFPSRASVTIPLTLFCENPMNEFKIAIRKRMYVFMMILFNYLS